jgi:ABC-type bacteriocin transporter
MKSIRQRDATDCGAACLAMVAAHHGHHTSVTGLRDLVATDKDGLTLKGLLDGAVALGFDAQALTGSAEHFTAEVPTPCIAHVIRDGAGHFVVVRRITTTHFFLLDPAKGRVKSTRAEFLAEWSGHIVVLAPGATFRPKRKSSGHLVRFLSFLTPHRSTVFWTIVASFVLSGLGIAGSYYYRFLVDEVLMAGSRLTVHVITGSFMVLALLQVLLEAVRSRMLLTFGTKMDASISLAVFAHLVTLPMSFFDGRRTGEVVSRLSDTAEVQDALTDTTFTLFFDAIMVLVVGVVLALRSVQLFVVALLTVPLSAAVVWGFAGWFRRAYEEIYVKDDNEEASRVESIEGIAALKAVASEGHGLRKMEERIVASLRAGYRVERMAILRGSIVGTLGSWSSYILFWVGSLLILDGSISLGQLFSFNVLLGYFVGPLQNLINLQPSLQRAMVAARRLGEIWDVPAEDDRSILPSPASEDVSGTRSPRIVPERLSGSVEFRDVTFRYGSRREVLRGLNLSLQPATHTVIVGANGSGKSTVVKLLMKFYRPEAGRITADGHDLADIDTTALRRCIGYVSQTGYLYSGTVFENISMGRPGVGLEEVHAAAVKCGADQLISSLPCRYDTNITEGGKSLSGGQRQRIVIARALVGEPSILILDEAANNLDSRSQIELNAMVRTLVSCGVTVISVAHDRTTLEQADRILHLKDGEVVEEGAHAELIDAGTEYAKVIGVRV